MGRDHRNERSGTLTGLVRVRQFTQDDAHIFCRPDQLQDEITALLALVREWYKTFDLDALVQAVDASREARSAPRRSGTRPSRRCTTRSGPTASPTGSTPATGPSTARRSTSTSRTRSAAAGRSPPSRSTSRCCPSASSSSTSTPTASPSGPWRSTARSSARTSASSASSSSTTPARSRRGSPRCRRACCRSARSIVDYAREVHGAPARRAPPRRARRPQREARLPHPRRAAAQGAVHARGRRAREAGRHREPAPPDRRGPGRGARSTASSPTSRAEIASPLRQSDRGPLVIAAGTVALPRAGPRR